MYIAYWSICLSWLCALALFGLKGIWGLVGRIWMLMIIFQIVTSLPLLATSIYARELFVRRSIIVFAEWIWSMMLPLVIIFGFFCFWWHWKFLVLSAGALTLPIALSASAIKHKTTLTLLAIYTLYFFEFLAMFVLVRL